MLIIALQCKSSQHGSVSLSVRRLTKATKLLRNIYQLYSILQCLSLIKNLYFCNSCIDFVLYSVLYTYNTCTVDKDWAPNARLLT